MEGALARKQLIEDRAERKEIGAVVGSLAANLFRRHVAHGAENNSGFRALGQRGRVGTGSVRLRHQLGQPEVENLDSSIFREK